MFEAKSRVFRVFPIDVGVSCPGCDVWVPFNEHAAVPKRHVVIANDNYITVICPAPTKRRSFTVVRVIA